MSPGPESVAGQSLLWDFCGVWVQPLCTRVCTNRATISPLQNYWHRISPCRNSQSPRAIHWTSGTSVIPIESPLNVNTSISILLMGFCFLSGVCGHRRCWGNWCAVGLPFYNLCVFFFFLDKAACWGGLWASRFVRFVHLLCLRLRVKIARVYLGQAPTSLNYTLARFQDKPMRIKSSLPVHLHSSSGFSKIP